MIRGVGKEVKEVFGHDGIHWSCLGHEGEARLVWAYKKLTLAMPRIKGRKAIVAEIGTHRGVSSTILALAGAHVITFDIEHYELRERIWEHFGVESVIEPHIIYGNEHLAQELEFRQFDIAFIDGDHAYTSVAANFDAVKKCGRVIFHDYEHQKHKARTVRFVDKLPEGRITKFSPFAIWESLDVVGCLFEGANQ